MAKKKQNIITRENIEFLVELQRVELQKGSLRAKLDALPGKIAAMDSKLSTYRDEITQEELALSQLQKTYRSHENEIRLNTEREKKIAEKLASVKNNKEYQSVLKEGEDLKRKNSDIEDQMLEILDAVDRVEEKLEDKKKQFESQARQIQREKETARKGLEAGERELEQLEEELEQICERIPLGLLDKFTNVKRIVGHVAIVAAQNAVCNGCHLNIPPQMYNELHRFDSLKFCPHCQRIIYSEAGLREPERSLNRVTDLEESPNTGGQGAP